MNPKHKLWLILAIGVIAMIALFAFLGDPKWLTESIRKSGGIWDWRTK